MVQEKEEVRLANMLMWSADNPGLCHRDISHRRDIFGQHLIVSKELRQPPPLVKVFHGLSDDHSFNGDILEHFSPSLLAILPTPLEEITPRLWR